MTVSHIKSNKRWERPSLSPVCWSVNVNWQQLWGCQRGKKKEMQLGNNPIYWSPLLPPDRALLSHTSSMCAWKRGRLALRPQRIPCLGGVDRIFVKTSFHLLQRGGSTDYQPYSITQWHQTRTRATHFPLWKEELPSKDTAARCGLSHVWISPPDFKALAFPFHSQSWHFTSQTLSSSTTLNRPHLPNDRMCVRLLLRVCADTWHRLDERDVPTAG